MNTSYTIKDCNLIKIPTFTDERGSITVIDKELPFEVKRIFWLHHIQYGQSRGGHALLNGTEILCAVHGSFVVELFDGVEKTCVMLDIPNIGLIIRPGIWFSTKNYKDNGVSLILASEEYERNRYTYDFEEYLRMRMK